VARNDVALLLTELGRFDEARPLYRTALEELEGSVGAGALDTLVARNNLAALELRRGDLPEAERLFRAVLAGAGGVAPSEQAARLLAAARRGLADLLDDRGELAEARALLEQALADLRAVLSERDTDVLATLANLAAVEASAGQLEAAIEHLEHCRAGYAELLRPEHPYLLTIQGNLGTLLRRAGRLEESEALLRAAFDGRRARTRARWPRRAWPFWRPPWARAPTRPRAPRACSRGCARELGEAEEASRLREEYGLGTE
jgi:tetratricopeptide (TPR) repeat protein